MDHLLEYTSPSLYESALIHINKKEDFKILVKDTNKIKWFRWYLPFLLDTTKERQPILKSLYCFYKLRSIHAVFGSALENNGYSISYNDNKDSELIIELFASQ